MKAREIIQGIAQDFESAWKWSALHTAISIPVAVLVVGVLLGHYAWT